MRCHMRSHAVRYLRRHGERETPGEMLQLETCSTCWRGTPLGGSAAGGGPTLDQ